jgi:hypothetical protein
VPTVCARVGDFGATPGLPANLLATTLTAQIKVVANQMGG